MLILDIDIGLLDEVFPFDPLTSLLEIHIHDTALLLLHSLASQERLVTFLDDGHVVGVIGQAKVIEDRLAGLSLFLSSLLLTLHGSGRFAVDLGCERCTARAIIVRNR